MEVWSRYHLAGPGRVAHWAKNKKIWLRSRSIVGVDCPEALCHVGDEYSSSKTKRQEQTKITLRTMNLLITITIYKRETHSHASYLIRSISLIILKYLTSTSSKLSRNEYHLLYKLLQAFAPIPCSLFVRKGPKQPISMTGSLH